MRTPPPGSVLWHIADAQARIAVLREALEVGDHDYAAAVAERLELDLGAFRQQLETEAAA